MICAADARLLWGMSQPVDEAALAAMGFTIEEVRAVVAELPANAQMQHAIDRLVAGSAGRASADTSGRLLLLEWSHQGQCKLASQLSIHAK